LSGLRVLLQSRTPLQESSQVTTDNPGEECVSALYLALD
jgi:hypothetical protein